MAHVSRQSLLALGLAMLAVGVAVAQEQAPADPFVSGVELVRAGRYAEAEQALTQAVAQAPDNQPAWFYLGLARFRQGNDSGALEAFLKARDLAPGRPGPMFYIGQIYERQGAYAEALNAYARDLALRRGQEEAEVYCAQGRTYYRLERYEDAREALTKALGLEPKMVEAMYWLGRTYTALQQLPEAERIFTRAREILLDWQAAKIRLERKPIIEEETARIATDEPKVAQEYFWAEQFASVLVMWPELNKAMGDLYVQWKRWPEARNAYRRALERSEGGNPDDPDVFVRVGLTYLQDAQQEFASGGRIYTCINILREAIKAASKAVELNAKYAPAYYCLGKIYACQAATFTSDPEHKIESHTFEQAVEQYRRALDLEPDYVEALVGIGEALVSFGDQQPPASGEAAQAYAEAIRYLEKAVTLAPRQASAHAQLARAYLAADRGPEALAEAEEALKCDPKQIVALNTAGSVYYYRGELAFAAEYFSRAIQANPGYAQSHVNLGNTYFQMQSWVRARDEYRKALDLIPTAKIANTAFLRARLYYTIALTYDHTLNYDKEIEELSKAIYLDDAYFDAYLQLARAYQARQDYRAAEQALRVAVQKASSDEQRVQAYVQLGKTLEQAGKPHEAVAAYTAAAHLDPQNPLVQDALQRLRVHAQTPS
jgi:tetratricopeptide (TPR) repeat protein